MQDYLAQIDILFTWFGQHPILTLVLFALLNRIVKATPWRGDDDLIDVIRDATRGKNA